MTDNLTEGFEYNDKSFLKPKARFIVKDMKGNPKFVIEELDSESTLAYSNNQLDNLQLESAQRLLKLNLNKEIDDLIKVNSYLTDSFTKNSFVTDSFTTNSFEEKKDIKKYLLAHTTRDIESEVKTITSLIKEGLKSENPRFESLLHKKKNQLEVQNKGHSISKEKEDTSYSSNYMNKFPLDVQAFVNNLNVHQNIFSNLNSTLDHIKEYLNSKNVEHEIIPGIYTDPEFPEWQEIEFKIRIKGDLDYIYKNFKPKIYQLIRQTIPEELLDKILIDFESFNS